MLSKLPSRSASEDGFTLAELLVVIMVIGILAAMALPTFLAQRSKAQDASAKSDARNLVTQVESCFTTELNYANCDTTGELSPAGENNGLPWGTAVGQVEVATTPAATTNSYRVIAHSKSTYNFTINKTANVISRMCSPAGKGGCPVNSSW